MPPVVPAVRVVIPPIELFRGGDLPASMPHDACIPVFLGHRRKVLQSQCSRRVLMVGAAYYFFVVASTDLVHNKGKRAVLRQSPRTQVSAGGPSGLRSRVSVTWKEMRILI